MQHLSKKFSGYAYLYTVIASVVWLVLSNLAFTFGGSLSFVIAHAALIHLLFRFLIFLPPIIVIAVKHSPREVLRIRPFTFAQLMFALGIGICAYFALTIVSTLLDKLSTALINPDWADFSGRYFPSHTFAIWPYLFTACLLPAVLEGGIFQGAMLSSLNGTRPLKACLTVGLLYALVQFDLAAFIPNALLGFALCYITLRSGSVIPAVSASFVYLLMERLSVTPWLNFHAFSPAGLSENTAAIILAVAFLLLGGLLLVKMPARKYEKGALKRSVRRVFPGLFSLSGLSVPLEDEPASPAGTPSKPGQKSQQLSLYDVLSDANIAPEAANMSESEASPRDNNPLIAGILISGIVTLVMLGLQILSALYYFQEVQY